MIMMLILNYLINLTETLKQDKKKCNDFELNGLLPRSLIKHSRTLLTQHNIFNNNNTNNNHHRDQSNPTAAAALNDAPYHTSGKDGPSRAALSQRLAALEDFSRTSALNGAPCHTSNKDKYNRATLLQAPAVLKDFHRTSSGDKDNRTILLQTPDTLKVSATKLKRLP